MPSGGHNIKPASLHIHEGGKHHSRLPRQKVNLKERKIPKKPAGLCRVATTHWEMVLRTRPEWIDESDGAALEQLCRTWAAYRAAAKALEKEATDGTINNYCKLAKSWREVAIRFGMDPASRESLGVVKSDESAKDIKARYLGA